MASNKTPGTDNIKIKLQKTPIAVVGVSAIFPDAENISQYWNNILGEVDSITDVPPSRWEIDDYYDPDPSMPDKTYCKRGGFMPDIDFNPMEFGLPPNILEVTDMSQLLSLVTARNLLKDSGYGDENQYDRKKIGVTLGVGGGQKLMTPLTGRLQYPVWKRVLTNSGISENDSDRIIDKIKKAYIPWEENSFPGFLGNVIAGRVANRLNLGGTNCVLDAACASSLTAVKMAISELLEHRSEMMITGGVDTDNSPFMYLSFSKTPAFTKDDNIKPFDADSKGMLIGEGIGMVLLKRLEDAERDHDKILSVIKGLGTSSDGKFKSIYAPRPEGQAEALKQTYEKAGYPPETIGLLEAHGTGTAAGDQAEFKALKMVFDTHETKKQHIALGSVKSQIGHTKSAAGSAGLIKAVLALHHKILPATINVKKPHPDMDIENTSFYLNTETRPWFERADGIPRRASVSAFGFGGTNFHITLEEYRKNCTEKYRIQHVPHMVILSGQNRKALLTNIKLINKDLKSSEKDLAFYHLITDYKLSPVKKEIPRCGFVINSIDEAIDYTEIIIAKLEDNPDSESWSHPKGIFYRLHGRDIKGSVVSLFSGQGSQYLNMGKEIISNFPPMMDCFSSMNSLFSEKNEPLLSNIVYPIPTFTKEDKKQNESLLQKTEHAQPAIGTLSAGMYKLFINAGFETDFTAGHSFGELTALWASGVLSETDYYFLARSRGKAMAAPNDESFDTGSMMAVLGSANDIEKQIENFSTIVLANHNSNKQSVIAGPIIDLQKAGKHLKENGFRIIPLPVSAAFHTTLVEHAKKPFAQALKAVKFKSPRVPVFSNSTSETYPNDPKKIKTILENHILKPVLFKEEIENIHKAGGRIFVEFGPKNVLTKLTGNILKGKDYSAISINSNPAGSSDIQLRKAAVELCVIGLPLKNPDPFGIDIKKPVPTLKNSMKINVNGANYVSEKTRQSYSDAMNDGFQIKQVKPVIQKIEVPVEKIVEVVREVPMHTGKEKSPEPIKKSSDLIPGAIKSVETKNLMKKNKTHNMDRISEGIDRFFKHASETVSVHSQYISNAGEYTRSFSQLMKQQFDFLKNNPGSSLPEGIDKSMEMFHKYHGETLKVHADYLKKSTLNSAAYLDMSSLDSSVKTTDKESVSTIAIQPPVSSFIPEHVKESPVTSTFIPGHVKESSATSTFIPEHIKESPKTSSSIVPENVTPAKTDLKMAGRASLDVNKIKEVMLSTVSEKTGYPVEMLDLTMDMEADLGIDSIKRVEILAAVSEKCPEIPQVNPDELAEIKTLGGIVEKFQSVSVNLSDSENQTPITIETTKTTTTASVDLIKLESIMISTVSEKTGYPVEMLDLDMDMEADLGIDSIKRVEILAAVTESYPDMPQVNPDELTDAKTLREIINRLKGNIDVKSGTLPVTLSASAPDSEMLTNIMLSVVSEKTGYPVDMLDLDMDMEADLGIDSIKRVEILAAVTESYPDMPQVNPDELTDAKTLREIVVRLKSDTDSIPGTLTNIKPVLSMTDSEKLTSIMLSVVSEKTGYPVEMLDTDMDMEADLGIDSIKRVEILAAVTDQLPELPQVNPDELTEMKTLQQIISRYTQPNLKLDQKQNQKPDQGTDHPRESTKQISSDTDISGAGVNEFKSNMLSVVSDKTGYPIEMLELDMDMEADLGIDSIKRVEILAAVTELHPELPQVNPDKLSELKTLGEIIDKLFSAEVSTVADEHSPESETSETKESTSLRSVATLTNLPEPDQIISHLEKNEICLLTDDGTELTDLVSEKLAKRGIKIVILGFPKEFIPESSIIAKNRIELSDMKESTLEETLAGIESSFGKIGGFVHLNPDFYDSEASPLSYSDKEQVVLKHIFLTAKHLKKQLTAESTGRHFFVTITRMDGKLGITGQDYSLNASGLFGLTKTLNHEWKNVYCRASDISRNIDVISAAKIIESEIYDVDARISETSTGEDGRYTLTPVEASPDFEDKNGGITEKSVFLVSGGAKGVTSECIIKLAQDTGCRFILLGRSEYNENEDSAWAKGITDEAELKKNIMMHLKEKGEKPTPLLINEILRPLLSKREIAHTLKMLKKVGSEALYISADVTRKAHLKKQLAMAEKKVGNVTGIIHGAGVLADAFIEDKTQEDFNIVYSTKVTGFSTLLSVVNIKKLTHVALFSSAAGFFGNEGQSDYAIANEILNKTAYKIQTVLPHCHVNAFDWGPWDGGMVTPELKRMFESRGVNVIPLDKGAELFSEEMRMIECFPQIIAGSSMVYKAEIGDNKLHEHTIQSTINLEDNRFLQDHAIGGNPVLPTVCATGWMAEACEKLHPGFKFFKCMNYKLYKGIVFDGNHTEDYTLHIKEIEKNKAGTLLCSVKITSTGKTGITVNHYSADIRLANSIPLGETVISPDLRETEIHDGAAFYENGTLFHGPRFQAVERVINITEQRMTMECRIPNIPVKDQGQFRVGTFNPYAADVQFQSMLIWVRHFMESGSLPSQAREGIHYSNVPEGKKFYVTLKIVKKTASSVTADIFTHDKEGTVFTFVKGAEVTVSKELNSLFEKAV